MDELIKAVTRAANAVAVYYEKQSGMTGKDIYVAPVVEVRPAGQETGAQIARTRKPRAPKAETGTLLVAPAAGEPVNLSGPILTEAQSEERLKVVGEAFVQRFSKQGDAVTEVKKTIEEKFKVVRLRDLVHSQRVELLAYLEARIREIDSKPITAAAAPAAVGLGL